jgi:cyclophilin family peptidyl-prolyl cis-trans isomerase
MIRPLAQPASYQTLSRAESLIHGGCVVIGNTKYEPGRHQVRGVLQPGAPHTENFLALCASGYYDDTVFHRNIKGFMV